MASPSIRVGVVGAGYWGINHVRVCSELGILDSVCDADNATRESVLSKFPGTKTVARLEELFSRPIEAVIIATPAQTHADVAIAALQSGKHVFVEKPLALTVADGERIAAAGLAAKREVFVGHLLLYHPAVRQLLAMLEQHAIGKVWHVRSRRLNLGKLRSYENVWWSFAPHDVALTLAIMKEEPIAASASQTSRAGGLSDMAYADFSFSDGRSAHIEVGWLDPDRSARLDVFGESGVITFVDSRAGSSLVLKRFDVRNDNGKPIVIRGNETKIQFEEKEALSEEVRAFASAVQEGRPTVTSVRHGIAVLRALRMADQPSRDSLESRALA